MARMKLIGMLLSALGWWCSLSSWALDLPQFPQDLVAPLDIPLNLAGSFGELRSQHYHAGWDLTTQGKVGLPVYAIADGEVVRVKIAPGGYGWVLYISHSKWGLTSVYAHLSDFRADIAEWMNKQQYSQKNYSVDINPPKGTFLVKKGEVIGKSGNSGSSSGPHVHFEIRNTQTEHPFDLRLFGYKLLDVTRPMIERLWMMPALVEGKPVSIDFNFGGESFGKEDSVFEVQGQFGVGVETFDYVLSAENKCGVQHIITLLDGNVISEWQMDSIDFDKTRHINSHIFKYPKVTANHFHRCYSLPGVPAGADHFLFKEKDGWVTIKDTLVHAITVMVADFSGNATCVYAYVQNREKDPVKNIQQPVIPWDKGGVWNGNKVSLEIPKNALYQDWVVQCAEGEEKYNGNPTPYFQFPDDFACAEKCILKLNQSVSDIQKTGWWNENKKEWYPIDESSSTKIALPGKYWLLTDSKAPTLEIDQKQKIPFEFADVSSQFYAWVRDDISGIKSIDGYINNEWVLLCYDAKNKLVYLDPILGTKAPGKIKIKMEDKAGNVAQGEWNLSAKKSLLKN
jgi:hypothetical protein